jgi:hypothetical protein
MTSLAGGSGYPQAKQHNEYGDSRPEQKTDSRRLRPTVGGDVLPDHHDEAGDDNEGRQDQAFCD